MDPKPLRIELLGGFRVMVGDEVIPAEVWRRRKVRSLVKLLALAPGHRLHREQVMDQLWPDLAPTAAANNLYQAVHLARRSLVPAGGDGPRYLYLQDEVLQLCPAEPLWIDIEAFEAATAHARQGKDPAAYRAALDLYTGDLLPEDRYDDWANARRGTLRQQYLTLLLELARLYEHQMEYLPATEALQQVLAADAAHEEVHRNLMRLYALSGARQQALRQYQSLQEVLRQELDVEPTRETQQLYRDILTGRFGAREQTAANADTNAPAPSSLPASPHNLPIALTSFVGREHEIAEVQRLLATTRLLMLAGPGGCGKTRLALEIAAAVLPSYPHGAWLVELAPLADPALVPQAVAAALGMREAVGQPLTETLAAALKPKHLLLLLDNCEHLIGACAQLAEALLRACPQLRILATSREPLHVPGEVIWLVPALSLPDPHHMLPLEDLLRYEAIRLFVERARAVVPSFQVADQHAAALAQICARLDGMPLAIELAAARVNMLTLEQLAGRLDDCFRLLTSGGRTALSRQQTLRATLDWSYDLLTDRERALLRRLAVFASGFTLEAAESVCTDQDEGGRMGGEEHLTHSSSPILHPIDVFDLLSRLVAKSLVMVEQQGEVIRYRLLETVRQYGDEKLHEAGEYAQVRSRHLAFFCAQAELVEPKLTRVEGRDWLTRLALELDNVRAALTWSQIDAENSESGLRLAGALFWFWSWQNSFSEARDWLDRLLAVDGQPGDTKARAKALYVAGELARYQADHAAARRLLEVSVTVGRALGDRWVIAAALKALGMVALGQGDYVMARRLCAESVRLFREVADAWYLAHSLYCLGDATIVADPAAARFLYEESLALYRQLGDTWGAAQPLTSLGRVALQAGDLTAAQTLLEESLAIRREMRNPWLIAISLNSLGDVVRCQGDYERAVLLYDEGLALARELGTQSTIAWSLHNLGSVALAQGDTQQAFACFAESLELERNIGSMPGIARSLAGLAGVAGARGLPERAARLLGAAEALLEVIGAHLEPADRIDYERDVATIRAVLGDDAFAANWAMGQAMTLEQAIAYAIGAEIT